MTKFEQLYLRLNPAPKGFPVGAMRGLSFQMGGVFRVVADFGLCWEANTYSKANPGLEVYREELPWEKTGIGLILHYGDEAKAAYDEAVRAMLEYETEQRQLEEKYFPGSK